ncbi:interaptin-like isoform X2 [Mercenaria mercenaria]|uniref:interaptin-like isoform X2 n=1 Tax=Mercenaria mercenaria TaxID=6596 RepID=UPI00234EBD2C|nr:interaptin-like isoform X2 [Mercenaria mercenaria]
MSGKEKVHELDESMIGFFKVFDQLTATLRLITDYQSITLTDDKFTPSEAVLLNGTNRKRLTKDVLVCIEESCLHEKSKSLQKLLQLLRFINDTAKKHSALTVVDLQLDKYKEEPSFKTFFINDFRQTQENEIKELKENQRALKQLLEISKRKETDFVKEKKEILSENKNLNDLNEQKDEENEKLRNSISSLQTDIDNLKSKYLDEWKAEKETLVERTEEKDEQIETLQNKVVELTENVETERKTADDLRKEYEKVKEELENIKCKKVLQVQLFYQRRGGLISEVEENLKEVLKMRLEDGKTELNFISCHSSSDISPDLPTLLIAICASRLGTDAANAIQGLSLHKKILLLIFHHKDVHALPSQASERVLTGQEFKSIGGIYDMAFLSQRGIYSCDLNEKSVTTVVSFLKASKG